MPFKILPMDASTLLFKLPHISNLFVFKENFTNDQGMVRIVTEILKFGQLEMIYMGSANGQTFNCEEYLRGFTDCALIRVNLVQKPTRELAVEWATEQFIVELENLDNNISVDSMVLDAGRNASTVDIVVAMAPVVKKNSSRYQAA